MIYKIPEEYYQRIHHSRPRFKNNQEEVLIFVATEINKLNTLEKKEFDIKLRNSIRLFPGNADKTTKTIDNWRTEISSFFGFIQRTQDNKHFFPSTMAKKLANEQDLIQFYKYFLYYFQYPGGHLKSQENKKLIEKGVKFKPAQCILKVLEHGEKKTDKRFFLTKAEVTHCIFNDLRVTRNQRNIDEIVKLILDNRALNIKYDTSGDVIRYAGDMLDYMNIADLVITHDQNKFYINSSEKEVIASFIKSDNYFNLYDKFYEKDTINTSDLTKLTPVWFDYINNDLGEELFKTDLYKYLGIEEQSYNNLVEETIKDFKKQLDNNETIRTKDIGDFGEGLILGHEKQRVKNGGRTDLLHKILKIPTQFAVGYDIQSVELDDMKRYIEVKTTISSKKLQFYSFHLTPNEWSSAATLKDRYFVYRLGISKLGTELHVVQDPVGLYKSDKIEMIPRDGADIKFNKDVSIKEDLLIWSN